MKKLLPLLALLIFSIACQKGPVEIEKEVETDLEDAFVHTAYFWYKEGSSAEEISAFEANSEKLRNIETVQAFFAGPPAATNRAIIENTYDYAIVFLFKNLEDQEYYQEHPIHKQLIVDHEHMWERVMVTDVDRE